MLCNQILFATFISKNITLDLSFFFSYSHSCGVIFWGNACHRIQIFEMQKRVIRIIIGCGNRDSCRILFKKVNMLSLMLQYTLSLLIFVVKNRDQFSINSYNYNIHTRHSSDLHLPSANLNIYQKGVYYSDIKIFNSLPWNIKKFSNNLRTFKSAVKHFLYVDSFYSIDEYYNNSSKYVLHVISFKFHVFIVIS